MSKEQPDMIAGLRADEAAQSSKEIAEHLSSLVANNRTVNGFGFDEMISTFYSGDAKHSMAWASYGYKNTLSFADFIGMYRRFGLGKSGIDMPVNNCWQTAPCLREDDEPHEITPWEKKIALEIEDLYFWSRLKGLDSRQRVGKYGGLLIIVRDDKKLIDPLMAGGLRPESLVKVIPLYQEQLVINTYVSDVNSVDYGQPLTYQYTESLVGDNSRTQERSLEVHASRVIPWAEGSDTDNITSGVPALEGCFNDLITLEKIIGAGGEGFWKNARGSININYNENIDIAKLQAMLGAASPEDIKDKYGEVIKKWVSGYDENLLTQGAQMTPLSIVLEKPKEFFDVALYSAASSLDIPVTVWIGQLTGKLASDEDSSVWAKSGQSRREFFLNPNIRRTVKYLMGFNLLTAPPLGNFFVTWDSLLEPTQKEKLDNAKTMSETNRNQLGTGEPVPYTAQQIAEMGGQEYVNDLDIDLGESDED